MPDAPHRRVTPDEVRRHRVEIDEVGRRYGVSNVRVFGSVARGEADDASDLDLLVDAAEGTVLLSLAQGDADSSVFDPELQFPGPFSGLVSGKSDRDFAR